MATLIDIEEDGRLEDENNTAEFNAVDSQEQPTEEDIPELLGWYKDTDRIFVCKPSKDWINYLKNDFVYVRKILSESVIVGYIQIDIKDKVGYTAVMVNPNYRHQGFASRLLKMAEEDLKDKVGSLVGYAESENANSIGLCRKLGYEGDTTKLDKDGMIVFKKEI